MKFLLRLVAHFAFNASPCLATFQLQLNSIKVLCAANGNGKRYKWLMNQWLIYLFHFLLLSPPSGWKREKNPWVMNHLAQWVHRDAIACTTEFGWVCAWVIATVVNRASTYERNATTTDCFKRVHRTLKRKTHFNFTNWWIKCESQRAREREGGREEDEKLKRND